MADTYLSTRREAERSQASALASLSGGLREDISRVSETFSGVSRQLGEQKKQISALQDALEAAETHRITQTKQLEWLTGDLNSLRVWVKFGTITILLLLITVLVLTVQLYRLH